MSEVPDRDSTAGGEGVLAPLSSNVVLVAGWLAATATAAALFWLATLVLYDYRPELTDTLGAILAETSRGLFIGAGLLGLLALLRAARATARLAGLAR